MSYNKRQSWGNKPYRPDMDFSQCKQSEPTDKYGSPEEIRNACFYQWDILVTQPENMIQSNSINLLAWCQKGLSTEEFKHISIKKPQRIEIGTAQNIANAVHHNLDWLRATQKRTWDGRPLNPMKQMLETSIRGQIVNKYNPLHYDEDPERR